MAITHTKVSEVADGADTTLVRPLDWNAAHTGQPTSISDFLDDTAGGTDAEVTKAPTSNAMYDGLLTKVPKSLYDANTILKADDDNTPIALAVAASRVIARLATGGIVAATAAEIATLLAGQSLVSSKAKAETRDLTAAAGSVSYTGYGFRPTCLIVFTHLEGTATTAAWSMTDSARAMKGTHLSYTGYRNSLDRVCSVDTDLGVYQFAIIASFDADGFTLTWYKGGSPTGTATLHVLALR